MSHVYNEDFYDYIEQGSRASARAMIAALEAGLEVNSVLDVGCGRGAWLSEWRKAGIDDATGLDGDYIVRESLHIPPSCFEPADLVNGFRLNRKFDLVQCLEVAEHLPADASETLVESLCAHGDVILFSAATPGQGGEHHINERPLEDWRVLFEARSFRPFDAVRNTLRDQEQVMPWYRYNTIIYANDAGRERLSEAYKATEIPVGTPIREGGSLGWRARRLVVSALPEPMVNWIARRKAAYAASRAGAGGSKTT